MCRGLIAGGVALIALVLPTDGLGGPPSCAGDPATIVEGNGNDNITGTPGQDVIFAGGGNDKIDGLGDNDSICGGPGNDKAEGGDGNDLLIGQAGKDSLKGGADDDDLVGDGYSEGGNASGGANDKLFQNAGGGTAVGDSMGRDGKRQRLRGRQRQDRRRPGRRYPSR